MNDDLEFNPISTAGRQHSPLRRRLSEGLVKTLLVGCASFSILTTFSIIIVLVTQTFSFFAIESPIITEFSGADASGPARPGIPVALQQEEGQWIAHLASDQVSALDFIERNVHVGDQVRVWRADALDADQPSMKAEETLIVTTVAPRLLRLESGPESIPAGPARIQIWRDEVHLTDFLFGTEWNPLLGAEKHFGIWPLICGTLLVTVVAMLIAIPFGLVTAIFLSEYAPGPVRAVLKPTLEVLAGVPTVVYGFFALTIITPFLRTMHEGFEIYNVFSAGIAVGIMCLPIVCSISEDALQAVPRALREGAYGLGATMFDVSAKVTVPAALSGIVAASLLAIARAVGETMIVALAAGNLAQMTIDVRDQAQTMTAYMVQIFLGDASQFGPEYYSSYAVAATLFVMTLGLTMLGHHVRRKFREEYD